MVCACVVCVCVYCMCIVVEVGVKSGGRTACVLTRPLGVMGEGKGIMQLYMFYKF